MSAHRSSWLCLILVLSLTACGGGGGDSDDSDVQQAAGGSEPATDGPAADDEGVSDDTPDPQIPDQPGGDGDDAGSDPAPPQPQEPAVPEAPPADTPPVANAGVDTAVTETTTVYLDGFASSDAEGGLSAFRWNQVAGPVVALEDPLAARTSFSAPNVQGSETLQFELTVTDEDGNQRSDAVAVTVHDAQSIPTDSDEFLSWLDDLAAPYVGSQQSAEAYYRAIDPLDQKTNLADWLNVNGFGAGPDARAVYRNAADLGFGRVMSLRTSVDGSVAAYVENYLTLEEAVDAADSGVRTGLLATVAMEFSPDSPGGEPYTKFYTFGPDDERIIAIDLDGRGAKFVPGLCNVCHGGQPKALVGGEYPNAGHTQAQFLPWDLETYEFSDRAGYTRADQEAELRALNAGALSTWPDAPVQGQWSGGAAREVIEGWYGGSGLPSQTFNPEFVPEGWRAEVNGGPAGNPSGIEALYLDVVAPNCRACHIMRGRYFSEHPEGELIDFSSYAKFIAWKDEIADLLYDSGVMPDALVTFGQFWTNHDGVIGAEMLARFLDIDATQQRPGRPVADAGPDRRVALGTVQLNGGASLFAEEFQWSFAPSGRPPGSGATLIGEDTATPTIVTDVPGVYRLELVVSGNGETSEPSDVTVMAVFGTDPVSYSADVASIIAASCAGCHSEGRDLSVPGISVRYDEPLALYERLLAYVNSQDYAASLLLSKPAGIRHGGQTVPGFDLSGAPGSDRSYYDRVLQWIGEGAPNN